MIDASALQALSRASSLELFHLAAVVERMMSEPSRILAIRTRLRLGQAVRYLDTGRLGPEMHLRSGIVIAMRDTTLTVQEDGTRAHRKLPYAAIEMPTADAARTTAGDDPAAADRDPPVRSAPRPGRADFSVGERVGFEDRHLQTRIGTIVRINQRTATVRCEGDGTGWRVPFGAMRRVIDL